MTPLLRTILCVVGIAWLTVLPCPTSVQPGSARDCGISFSATTVEVSPGDDFGATVEDSVEMLRADLTEVCVLINRTASASRFTDRSATSSRLDLSPPLLV